MSSAISANLVKDLREKTGAGMMECKKALETSKGDFEAAVKLLRESGAAKAAKREGRKAAEGLVAMAVSPDGKVGSLAELNCETDFVARNEGFQALVESLAATALASKANSSEELGNAKLADGRLAKAAVEEILSKIGEKIVLSRAGTLEADLVAGYIHPPGKIGVLVAVSLEGVKDTTKLTETLRDVAMHIAALSPRFLRETEVDEATLATEREIAANIARNEKKPENIIPKIVEGKVKAFYKENCLVNQEFVKDPKQTVQQVVEAAGKASGGKASLVRFLRFRVGETAAATTEE